MALAACSSGPALSALDRAAAITFVEQDQAPLAVRPVSIWAGDGFTCGEFETPARPGPVKRFLFVPGRDGFGAVEKDASWSGAGDPRGDEILYESQQIFGKTWSDHCAGYAPLGRRVAGWFGHKGEVAGGTTPITNAYMNDVLKKARGQ